MTPDQILSIPPKVLTQRQREFYFEQGYLLLERVIDETWLARLRAATDEMVERSRSVTRSDTVFDLEPDHRADAPRLRRVTPSRGRHWQTGGAGSAVPLDEFPARRLLRFALL